ncbi:MAG TPA: protein translocase subunit SecF [Kineosporiaceae bacterium]|nr:protein translocase subunit SecF [Kineosporiaceae bacterium]
MGHFAKFGNDLYTGRRTIQFVERRRTWYAIAGVLSLISVLALVLIGLSPGIEFRGGSEYRLTNVSDASTLIGEDAVKEVVPGSQAIVSKLDKNSIRVQTEKLTEKQSEEIKTSLAKAYKVPEATISASFVGPSWGADVSRKAIQGLIVFLVLVAGVIAAYFRTWKMAAAALIALLHDLLITVGVYALTGFEVTPASVIGFLTILGYSLYDTVVVFDKVRENTDRIVMSSRRTFEEAANLAINQTLVRSINTSVVALLPVGSILFIGAFVLGAGTLRDISLALFVGIAAGTYSSIFVATPLLVEFRRREPEIVAHTRKLQRRRAEAAAKQSGAPAPVYGSDESQDDLQDDEQAVGAGVGGGRSSGSAASGPAGQRRQPRRNSKNRPSGQRR